MINFSCPECDKRLKALPEQAGQWIRCPHCRAKFIVPHESSESFEEFEAFEPSEKSEAYQALEAFQAAGPVPLIEVKKKVHHHSHDDEFDEPISKPPLKIDHEELIDMTAMVDIVFFLLIFFLVTSMSGIQSSAQLPRPETQREDGGGKASLMAEPQIGGNEIIVKIAKDDTIEIEGVPYRDIADLVARLQQLRNANGADTSLLILGHGDASHGVAASILDAGYEVGINHLRMSVIDDESE